MDGTKRVFVVVGMVWQVKPGVIKIWIDFLRVVFQQTVVPFIDRDDVLIDAADSGIGYKHVDVDGVIDGMYF
jgi:hypothetical protein